jgi:hypothetical protein
MRCFALFAFVAACSTDIGPSQESACAAIEGHMFETPTALECGAGPNGPQTCIWHLSFDMNDTFHWQHSSVMDETGHVTCSGTSVSSAQPAYTGTFDLGAGTVTWQGQLYNKLN